MALRHVVYTVYLFFTLYLLQLFMWADIRADIRLIIKLILIKKITY